MTLSSLRSWIKTHLNRCFYLFFSKTIRGTYCSIVLFLCVTNLCRNFSSRLLSKSSVYPLIFYIFTPLFSVKSKCSGCIFLFFILFFAFFISVLTGSSLHSIMYIGRNVSATYPIRICCIKNVGNMWSTRNVRHRNHCTCAISRYFHYFVFQNQLY